MKARIYLSEKTQNWPISAGNFSYIQMAHARKKKFAMKFCLNYTPFFHYYIKIISTKN